MAKYLITLSTTKIEEIVIEADSRDEAMYHLSAGSGEVINEYRYGSSVESFEEMDA